MVRLHHAHAHVAGEGAVEHRRLDAGFQVVGQHFLRYVAALPHGPLGAVVVAAAAAPAGDCGGGARQGLAVGAQLLRLAVVNGLWIALQHQVLLHGLLQDGLGVEGDEAGIVRVVAAPAHHIAGRLADGHVQVVNVAGAWAVLEHAAAVAVVAIRLANAGAHRGEHAPIHVHVEVQLHRGHFVLGQARIEAVLRHAQGGEIVVALVEGHVRQAVAGALPVHLAVHAGVAAAVAGGVLGGTCAIDVGVVEAVRLEAGGFGTGDVQAQGPGVFAPRHVQAAGEHLVVVAGVAGNHKDVGAVVELPAHGVVGAAQHGIGNRVVVRTLQ